MAAPSPFEKVSPQADFPALEQEVIALWENLDAFQESNRRRRTGEAFVFYDGPPFATGAPHYGHLLAGTIKDIVPRYWSMRGRYVERRFGWDCHGLPIEALAQTALGLAGRTQIVEHGVGAFNEQCRSMVQTYVAEWRKTVTRMGRWVDFDNDYKTMDLPFMESVWWAFKKLWDQGRVYKSYRIMPYSWKLGTPLSNFEANSNYKDVQDPAITVRFRVTHGHEMLGLDSELPLYVVAWTTTPWTLPSNLALAVGADVEYVLVHDRQARAIYALAAARLGAYYPKESDYEIVSRVTGAALTGIGYEPLFPYFADQPRSFVILSDEFVTTEDGTGIVHLAPAYGEDDFRVCREAGIELVDPLDTEARFTAKVTDFAGAQCKDADRDIIKKLKVDGKLVRQDVLVHSYPFDPRTETPLIYRAIDAWYVRVADQREELVAANAAVNWVPKAVGENRFGNWLKDANDWNISRNRFWGSCLPVWVNESDATDRICVGSIDELEALSGTRVTDLHKHVVDEVVIQKDGKTYRRTPEVLDCWFESGAMPYAQQHYPFERGGELGAFFPADFIAEGLDQTRGWFYTLLVLGVSLFETSPYKNVVVNGLILAEDGQKMSKSKKNYPDPNIVISTHGADALRAYMIDSPVVRGEPLRFSERGLREIVRTVVLPYWNALSFFTTYAVVDGYDPRTWQAPPVADRPDIDRWMLSVLQSLVADVNREMEGYRLYNVVPRLVAFIDDLTNWFVRRSRPRFWKGEDDSDKASGYATLYDALVTFAKVLAPFMPFLTETVYQKLVRPVDAAAPASVHFTDYPQADEDLIDRALEERMAVTRDVVALARKVREDHKIKVRQPLRRLTVVHRDPAIRNAVLASAALIEDELNVKDVAVSSDENAFAVVTVKPNFKTLGKRLGPKLKEVGETLKSWGFEQVSELEKGGTVVVAGEALALEDVILQRSSKGEAAVATDGHVTVALDTKIDAALEREGIARELVSLLQNARKDAGLDVSDRIVVAWACTDDTVRAALAEHRDAISKEVLAVDFREGAGTESVEINKVPVRYTLTKHG
ncbi:MAG TPA: isoleucine--tRNA ligase [Polyangiaceae bacterium]|jgi:isoleucyl-tRNA synthetase|nr:isoleucine--tRNA ligase [Polyangiaceae bacterium]